MSEKLGIRTEIREAALRHVQLENEGPPHSQLIKLSLISTIRLDYYLGCPV